MFTLEYAKDPFFQTADQQCIHITVKWVEFAEEMPFGAMANDVEEHGRLLYARVIAGEFGQIAPYVPPLEPTQPITMGSQDL
jgi:hypothetical protein